MTNPLRIQANERNIQTIKNCNIKRKIMMVSCFLCHVGTISKSVASNLKNYFVIKLTFCIKAFSYKSSGIYFHSYFIIHQENIEYFVSPYFCEHVSLSEKNDKNEIEISKIITTEINLNSKVSIFIKIRK